MTGERSRSGIASKRGATLVRLMTIPFVIAGQGTAGREIAEDMTAREASVPTSWSRRQPGGGLIARRHRGEVAASRNAELIVAAEPKG